MLGGAPHNSARLALLTVVTVVVVVVLTLCVQQAAPDMQPLALALSCAAAVFVGFWGAQSGTQRSEHKERQQREQAKLIAHYLQIMQTDELVNHTQRLPEEPTQPEADAPSQGEPARAEQLPAPSQPTVTSENPALTAAQTHGSTPLAPTATQAALPRTSRLDFPRFSRELCTTPDPLAYLRSFVDDVYARRDGVPTPPRQASAGAGNLINQMIGGKLGEGMMVIAQTPDAPEAARYTSKNRLPPCPEELWLAQQLDDAGLMDEELEMPFVQAIRPTNSHMVYLRILAGNLSWKAITRVIEIEAALNRARLATTYFDAPHEASFTELMEFSQRFESSVCGQWREVADLAHSELTHSEGEWAFREAFSTAIETVQLPYRLAATFRANLEAGAVALEVELTPSEAFPKRAWNPRVGRVLPTTAHLREMAAGTYAARVALLLAAIAFACSDQVRTVSIAGVSNHSNTHTCLYSVEFDRLRFETVDLSQLPDPVAVLRSFGANVHEVGGALQPVTQNFILEDERFCPKGRYVEPAIVDRPLTQAQARALGCHTTADLEINEDVWRRSAASSFVRKLDGSVAEKVATILGSTGELNANIAEAGQRTARKLIAGELDDENPYAVEDEFVNGDVLTRAVEKSLKLIEQGEHAESVRMLRSALEQEDADARFADEPGVSRRYFNNYIERVIYNRVFAEEGARVELVPDAYYNIQLLLATSLYELGNTAEALARAERAHELDPLDERAVLRMVRCYEREGDYDRAVDLLNALLRHAHTNESLGVAYYRMAFMQYLLGNTLASETCYRKSLKHASSCSPAAFMELMQLHGLDSLEASDDDVDEVLEQEGVTVAPTSFVSHVLADAARAATDAEVFPVARNLAQAYGALEGSDILLGVIRSIEREPDR